MDPLSGSLISLRPLKEEDLEYLASLKNDMRTQAAGRRLPPRVTPTTLGERYTKTLSRPLKGLWCIETIGGELVGTVEYDEYAPRLGAIVGIMMGTEHWGKGYGKEALELIIRFLFEERGLHLVNLWTTSWNVRMVGLAEKLGFKIAIREREGRRLSGAIYDGVFMDMLREEYYSSRGLEDSVKSGLGDQARPC
jgi:RimJ/RimL family protein N-acetyltransferase